MNNPSVVQAARLAEEATEQESPHALDGELDLHLARSSGQSSYLVAAGNDVEDLAPGQGDLIGKRTGSGIDTILPESDAGPRRGPRQASESCRDSPPAPRGGSRVGRRRSLSAPKRSRR